MQSAGRWLLAGLLMVPVAAVAVAAWARTRVLVVQIHGSSMTPTYRPGERLLAVRAARRPRRGDVLVFRLPAAASEHATADERRRPAVKRVAAVAGDPLPGAEGPVPDAHVFLVGDRARTLDSRVYGPVPLDHVVGRVVRARPAPGGHAEVADGR
ncbi:MAG: S26 family signal peptidase [Actinocatenispora sp.]